MGRHWFSGTILPYFAHASGVAQWTSIAVRHAAAPAYHGAASVVVTSVECLGIAASFITAFSAS
ncbi:MAG: hypothetical protein AABW86_01430 [Candidatus Micrarchaeota archaeon]